jgi:flavin reductase (DIM6/NTAB) family NADH-FMN oxidoreductase RutF
MLGTSAGDNLRRDIYIATAKNNDTLSGQVITWVTHASLMPDRRHIISVFSKFNHTYLTAKKSGTYALNLVSPHQLERVYRFGLYSGNDTNKYKTFERFSDFNDYKISKQGNPILDDVPGYCEVKIIDEKDLGDRIIVIGQVTKDVFNKENQTLSLIEFLNNAEVDMIALQKKNLISMIERDSQYINL